MGREEELDLAKQCYTQAMQIDSETATQILKEFKFEDRTWLK
jgi:hypothetical protein